MIYPYLSITGNPVWDMLLLIGCVVVSLIIGIALGIAYRKRVAEKAIEGAETEAKRIINDAIKSAEGKKREAVVEANEQIHKKRVELERENKERRAELQKQERRLEQKEENLDKKLDNLEKKEEALAQKVKENEAAAEEIKTMKRSQMELLEKISGYTAEEAKTHLINLVETDARHSMALKIKEVENQYKEESEERARELLSTAIQKCAADHVAEAAVSVVPLPNDEMKGRIIGREGRNIRTLETLTGVDLIIDDTPEAITLSGFDPVRREIARLSLEKLIIDGRIHPARIEEMVEKARREVDQDIKQAGEQATFDTSVLGVHPEVIKLLGKLRFRTSYGQNVLKHSVEVAHLAGALAAEMGLDVTLAKRAGLLHDIGKAMDHEIEGSHISIGVDIAKKYKENDVVINAIESHHGDVEPKTFIACLVQAADAISAARPGARRENLENYIKRLEKLEEIANGFNGVERSFAIQAGREIRIMIKPDVVDDDGLVLLANEMSKKIENELEYPGQIKVHLIRETRYIEYAK